MAKDIEEFLRRAAERRNQQSQKRGQNASQRQPASQYPEIVQDVEVVQNVEVVQRQSLRQRGVSENVRSHINTSEIAYHAEHLGEGIQNTDDRAADRIEEKFDGYDSPRKERRAPTVSAQLKPSTISQDLVQMLSSPENVRQAILVSEILKRPDFDQ